MSKWEEVRLNDICKINPTVKLNKNEIYDFLPIEDLDSTKFYVNSYRKKEYIGQSASKFINGDILFSRITPCLENRKISRCILRSELGFGSTEFFVFRANSKSNQSFLHYFVSSDYIVLPAINSMTGASGRQRADKKFIERLKIKIPNLPTQEKIANILSTYDKLIENNNKRIRLLEKASEELYKEWFVRMRFPGYKDTRIVNGVPEGWEVKKIGKVIDRLPFEKLYKKADVNGVGIVIVIDQSKDEFIGFHDEKADYKATDTNPIIIFGDHSCKMKIMINEFSLSENVIPFISNIRPGYEYFLYYAFKDIINTTEYKRHWTEFINRKVFIPEDKLIDKYIQNIRNMVIKKTILWYQNQNLIKQRDLLLPRLMSGKLEV